MKDEKSEGLKGAVSESVWRLPHGAEGYVVVETLRRGTSAGGVRISDDLTLEEVRALAREMSLKFGFFGLARGGAKSGIRLPGALADEERREVLEAFGGRLRPLVASGRYYPGMDMNCGPCDLQAIYRGAGVEIGAVTDTSRYTALSAANALAACRAASFAPGRRVSVAVEGFGSVGAWLARLLPPDEFRITAIATVAGGVFNADGFDGDALARLRGECGDAVVERVPGERIGRRELPTLPVDLFVPAARTWSLDAAAARALRAVCVVPVANAPYAQGSAEALHDRGVLCLPGFVCNGGGVFASSLADSGVKQGRIEAICREIYRPVVAELICSSRALGVSPVAFAEQIARERLRKGEGGSLGHLLKRLRRRGLVPGALYGPAVQRLFGRDLGALEKLIRSQAAKG